MRGMQMVNEEWIDEQSKIDQPQELGNSHKQVQTKSNGSTNSRKSISRKED